MPENWSQREVEAVVQDYFDMLKLELSGKKYNKTEHRRALRELLNDRSDGSVELKHQNISAVLIEMGMPYIEGYKPRVNYQRSLIPAVSSYLSDHPDILELFREDSEISSIVVPSVDDLLSVMETAPMANATRSPRVAEAPGLYVPVNMNFLEREARNQKLGDAGEQFVINYERARLLMAGKHSLADRIEQVSVTVGPSAGYDIRSFELNGFDRLIEAKTTKYGKYAPFFVTPNELRFSKKHAKRYHLYRLFGFRESPRMFDLPGEIGRSCSLEPSEFIARLR